MKIQSGITAALLLLSCAHLFGQSENAPGTRGAPSIRRTEPPADTSALTKFNLDFPGGTPKQLITAIQKALGKPLNAVVPDEFAEVKLPALKMTNVNAHDLFTALSRASRKTVPLITSTYYGGGGNRPTHSYQTFISAYGFKTEGTPTDESIWTFYNDQPAVPPDTITPPGKLARFYLLTPYLERGLTVDDITTAIKAAWKMLGDADTPAMSFHKETKLLIAVGDERRLDTIDAVLQALDPLGAGGRRFGGGGFGGAGGFGGGGRSAPPVKNTPQVEE